MRKPVEGRTKRKELGGRLRLNTNDFPPPWNSAGPTSGNDSVETARLHIKNILMIPSKIYHSSSSGHVLMELVGSIHVSHPTSEP